MNNTQKKFFLLKKKAYQHCFGTCLRTKIPYSRLRESYYHFILRQLLPVLKISYNETLRLGGKTPSRNKRNVWVMWWQGVDNAPKIVKNNIKIMQEVFGDRLKIITQSNASNYINISSVLSEKFKKGIITQPHWADIVRVTLLSKYGGLWIDSTVMVSKNVLLLPELWERPFISICSYNNGDFNISRENWSSWFIGGEAQAPVFAFLKIFFDNYFKQFDFILDYFLMDYAIYYFYSQNDEFSKEVEAQKRNWHALYFYNNLYKPIDKVNVGAFRNNIDFCVQKLTYKVDMDKLKSNSLYIQILNGNLGNN